MKKAIWIFVALAGCASGERPLGNLWKDKFILGGGGEYVLPRDARAVLFFFIRPDCPITNAYGPEIRRLVREYQPRGIASVMVYAEAEIEPWKAVCHSFEFDAGCPAILDPKLVLAGRLGVTVTPEAAAVSSSGELLYRGRIDDRYAEAGRSRRQATRHDLRDALECVLADRSIPCPKTESVGSPIVFPRETVQNWRSPAARDEVRIPVPREGSLAASPPVEASGK
jgi:hypothetical protein